MANVVGDPIALEMFQNESRGFTLAAVVDANGNAVNLSGKTLRFVAIDNNDPAVAQFQVDTAGIVVSGTGNNVVKVTIPTTASGTAGTKYLWHLWNLTDDDVLHHGSLVIKPALKSAS